jgi:prophage regulatory protein
MTVAHHWMSAVFYLERKMFWKLSRVQQECGHMKSWIYDAVKRGDFPAPVKLSTRSVAWIAEEVIAWQKARINASRIKVV